MNKLDADTQEVLSDTDELVNLTNSKGWAIAKSKLDQRILDLQNINNIDLTKPETLAIQLAARKLASDLLFEWLQGDIYGVISQNQSNAKLLEDKQEDSFIVGRE